MIRPPQSSLASLHLAAVIWSALLALCAGCQSSVRVTPGAITGMHERTITTIGPVAESRPAAVLHVRLQEAGK